MAKKEKNKEDTLIATKNEENTKQTTSAKTNDAGKVPVVSNKIELKHNYKSGKLILLVSCNAQFSLSGNYSEQ